MAMKELKDLHSLCEDIFDQIKNDTNNKNQISSQYSIKLYKRILDMSNSCIKQMNKEEFIQLPLSVRNMIESVVDLANLRLYGNEYANHMKLVFITNELDFIRNNFDDYKNLLAPNGENRDINEEKRSLYERKEKVINLLKKNKNITYIKECILPDGSIDNSRVRSFLTQQYKFKLLLENPKYDYKAKRHKRYRTGYYLLSKFIHNSIEFMSDYNPEENIDAYSELIASILKNGSHYLSDINNVRIKNKNFDKLSSLMKKIKKTEFNIDYSRIDLFFNFDLEV